MVREKTKAKRIRLSLFRSDKTKWHKLATIRMSVFGWSVKHGKHRHKFVYHLSRHVTIFTLGFSVQKEVLELFCILHLLDIFSYKHTVCFISHSHFHYLWGIFLTQIWSSSNGLSHKSVVNLFITMITNYVFCYFQEASPTWYRCFTLGLNSAREKSKKSATRAISDKLTFRMNGQ